jgi:hypothetical protein
VDLHVAAVVDQLGGVVDVEAFETTEAGYQRLVGWLRSHGNVQRVGVEGTGSYEPGWPGILRRPGSVSSRSIARTARRATGPASPTRSTPSLRLGRRWAAPRSACPSRGTATSRPSGS